MAILVFHSIIRWAILITGIWAVLNGRSGMSKKRAFSSKDKLSGLLFMIFCDLQLLLGIIVLYSNGWFDKIKAGMGALMKNSYDRFFVVEHGLMMIIAWILVHVGYSKMKNAADDQKHRKMVIFFGIALILILISIPWPHKPETGRPLFRWFN